MIFSESTQQQHFAYYISPEIISLKVSINWKAQVAETCAIVIKHVDQDEPQQSNKILIIFYTTQIYNDSVMEQISVLPTEKKSILQHSAYIFEDTAMDTTPKCWLVMMS